MNWPMPFFVNQCSLLSTYLIRCMELRQELLISAIQEISLASSYPSYPKKITTSKSKMKSLTLKSWSKHGQQPLLQLSKQQLRWNGHVLRILNDSLPKCVCCFLRSTCCKCLIVEWTKGAVQGFTEDNTEGIWYWLCQLGSLHSKPKMSCETLPTCTIPTTQ